MATKRCAGIASLLFVIALAFAPAIARSTTFEPMDFARLVDSADVIFIGTASSASSRFTTPRSIVTDFEFVGIELLKGDPSPAVPIVRVRGGRVGNEELVVQGAPAFQSGTRYLLFIAGNGKVIIPLLGGPQGVYQVRLDPATGAELMHDYGGRPLVALPGEKNSLAAGAKSGAAVPVMTKDELVGEIRRRLSRPQ